MPFLSMLRIGASNFFKNGSISITILNMTASSALSALSAIKRRV